MHAAKKWPYCFSRGLAGLHGGSVQFVPKLIEVARPKEREQANPAHLVRRDWIVLDPVAARILVEVATGVGTTVDG